VPPEPFRDAAATNNPNITIALTPHGGHCAYLERGEPGYDGYWAEREVIRFVGANVAPPARAGSPAAEHVIAAR